MLNIYVLHNHVSRAEKKIKYIVLLFQDVFAFDLIMPHEKTQSLQNENMCFHELHASERVKKKNRMNEKS